MRTLVLGAQGQLGTALSQLLPDAVSLTRAEASATDPGRLRAIFEEHRPEVVFNCAAYNAVDTAESNEEVAYAVNSQGPLNVALACGRVGARIVHFSTNFVFDGKLDRPYVEDDEPRPLSVYGRSKLDGERRLLDAFPGALVIRTAALFGRRPPGITNASFPDRILALAARGEPLRVVADQKVNPTYAPDLAAAALGLAEKGMDGVVHLVARGCCRWDEFAKAVLAECGVTADVGAIESSSLASPAKRPLNGCLGSTRVEALRSWREGLAEWAGGLEAESDHP